MQFNKVFRAMVTGWLLATLALPGTPLLAADGRGRDTGGPAAVQANSLLALDVQEATQTTVLTIRGNLAPTFTTFKLDKPARLFVDVAGASVGSLGEPKYVNNGVIRSVEAVPFARGNATYARIVVTFEQDALYHVRSEGNAVVIVVDGSDRKLNQAQTAQIAAAEDAAKPRRPVNTSYWKNCVLRAVAKKLRKVSNKKCRLNSRVCKKPTPITAVKRKPMRRNWRRRKPRPIRRRNA